MGPSRPNPLGGWGLRAISLSLVVVDVPASPPPHLRDLASQAPSANVTVFMKGSTKVGKRFSSKGLPNLSFPI